MCAKKLTPDELPAEEPQWPIPGPVLTEDTPFSLDPATLAPVVAPPAEPPMIEIPVLLRGLSIGRIVHYVLTMGRNAGGSHRAAILTKIIDPRTGLVDLTWFTTSDDHDKQHYDTWQQNNVPLDPAGMPGSWHWPEQV